MGNREDLLEGAKRCIVEKGLAHTTARDLATAAGTSLAAIGYHFGGKEALLSEALLELMGTGMGDALDEALKAHAAAPTLIDGFVATWTRLLDGFAAQHPALVASLENLVQSQRMPEVAAQVALGQREAMREIAETFAREATATAEESQAVAALYYTLLNGLVMTWLVDAASVPSAETLGRAITVLTGSKRRVDA